MKHLKVRIPMYFIGLFVMTIGIALSVKSNLGVSPVSSIPYTITCVWGIEMGKATILSPDTGQPRNPYPYGACQHGIRCSRHLFISAG